MNPKILKFFILKVTKFIGKISQFEFLVITKKYIFAYKLFLSLNISDFSLCDNCTPPEKSHLLFPSNQLRSCQAPLF